MSSTCHATLPKPATSPYLPVYIHLCTSQILLVCMQNLALLSGYTVCSSDGISIGIKFLTYALAVCGVHCTVSTISLVCT